MAVGQYFLALLLHWTSVWLFIFKAVYLERPGLLWPRAFQLSLNLISIPKRWVQVSGEYVLLGQDSRFSHIQLSLNLYESADTYQYSLPVTWAMFESDYAIPCIYNQGKPTNLKISKLIRCIFWPFLNGRWRLLEWNNFFHHCRWFCSSFLYILDIFFTNGCSSRGHWVQQA